MISRCQCNILTGYGRTYCVMYDSSGRRFSLDLSKQLAESIVSVASRAGGPHSGLTGIVVLALGELLDVRSSRLGKDVVLIKKTETCERCKLLISIHPPPF